MRPRTRSGKLPYNGTAQGTRAVVSNDRRHRASSTQSDDSEAGDGFAQPEPSSGVVDRGTGLAVPAQGPEPIASAEVIPSDQRDTPQFDLWAGRTPPTPMLSPEEADRQAERICPIWQEPGLVALKQLHTRRSQLEGPRARDEARSAPWLERPLRASEADAYAARLRQSWQVPFEPPQATRAGEAGGVDLALRPTEYAQQDALHLRFVGVGDDSAPRDDRGAREELDDAHWRGAVSPRQQVRGWLVAVGAIAGFAAFGLAALWAPASEAPTPRTDTTALGAARAADSARGTDAPSRLDSTRSAARSEATAPPASPQAAGPEQAIAAAAANDVAAPSAGPATKPESLPQGADATSFRVRVSAEPPKARIRLDGKLVTNPFDERRPRGTRHRLLIEARGYASRDLMLNGDRDENLRVQLVRLQHPTAAQR